MMDTVTTAVPVEPGILDAIRISHDGGLAASFQIALMYAGIAILTCLVCYAIAWCCLRAFAFAARSLRPVELAVFAVLVCFLARSAQKNIVSYPRTDPTTEYLADAGSYVDSDTDIVHIDFRRVIVPDSAMFYVDRLCLTEGDESWENVFAATFGETPIPLEITCQNATNYRWIVYTDWTPGPAVQTNGVWHANWSLDRRARRYLIPLRTAVRIDGETIATPKSKEDANANP